MAERQGTSPLQEKSLESAKVLSLSVLPRDLLIGESDGNFPVFRYHMRQGEVHAMNDILLELGEICLETNSTQVIFRQTRDFQHDLDLDLVNQKCGIIRIGNLGRIALRKIKEDGLVMFDMCLDRDIRLRQVEPLFSPLK